MNLPDLAPSGAKKITPECRPDFNPDTSRCWIRIAGYDTGVWVRLLKDTYEDTPGLFDMWAPDSTQPPAKIPPASPSPFSKESLDAAAKRPKCEPSPVTEEKNSRTCEEDFQHYLTYSQQAHLSDADKATLRHAYSAAWSPTPSPFAPAQQEQAEELRELVNFIAGMIDEIEFGDDGESEITAIRLEAARAWKAKLMARVIVLERSSPTQQPLAPSAAQQDKGWAERAAEEMVSHNYHVEALKKGGTYEREVQSHLAIILRHAQRHPSSLSAQVGAADTRRLDWLERTEQQAHYCGVFRGGNLTRASIDAAMEAST